MTNRELRSARAIVVKARKWLDSPDKLVENAFNIFEDADGVRASLSDWASASRVCTVGCFFKFSDHPVSAHVAFEYANPSYKISRPHTLKQVHAAYDRTIAWIDRQLAKGA